MNNDLYSASILDQMTLDLLANRKKGAVPAVKQNPVQAFLAHQKEIKKIIYQLLSDPSTEICNEVNEAFDQLIYACVRHIEIKTHKWATRYDEELFPTNNMIETSSSSAQARRHTSLWGHAIHKIMPTLQVENVEEEEEEEELNV